MNFSSNFSHIQTLFGLLAVNGLLSSVHSPQLILAQKKRFYLLIICKTQKRSMGLIFIVEPVIVVCQFGLTQSLRMTELMLGSVLIILLSNLPCDTFINDEPYVTNRWGSLSKDSLFMKDCLTSALPSLQSQVI